MKRVLYYWLFIFVFSVSACSKSDTPTENNSGNTNFTSADADTAFAAFNRTFYNPTAKLYYNNSNHDGTGAIWTQAIFWDIVMDAYLRTNKPVYKQMIDDIYLGGYMEYDGYNWNNKTEWFIYDDMMWWIGSLARAYQITGTRKYLDLSQSGFAHVWNNAYDTKAGGMFWAFDHGSKNSCINFPTVIAAMRLYNITGDTVYLDRAKAVYWWAKNNLVDGSSGRVADYKTMDGHLGWDNYTYNQGTYIGAGVMLFKATGDQSYLEDAKLGADFTKTSMCNSDGILPAEGDWNEQGVLKAIFARYVMMLINDCNQTQYLPWIQKNINTAWANRDKSRNITFRDYTVPCPKGLVQSYEASSIVGFMQICPTGN